MIMHVLAHRPALAYATQPLRFTPPHHAVIARPDIPIAGVDLRQPAALSTRFDHGWLHETLVGGSSPDRIISSD
jgi:hypothetical protein